MKYEFTKVDDLVMKRRNAPCLLANNLPRDRRNIERMYGNVRIVANGVKTRPFYLNFDIIREMVETDPKFFAEFGIGLIDKPEPQPEPEPEEIDVAEELGLDEVDDIPFTDDSVFKSFEEETPEPPTILVDDMSYKELKEELTRRGIEFKGNISKADAIAKLKEE